MDEFIQRVRKTDLTRHTRKILSSIQRGQTVVVEHHGQAEVAIMDILDYRIQRAFIYYYSQSPKIIDEAGLADEGVAEIQDEQQKCNLILSHYLAENINLNRSAELLGIPWLDLRTRFLRLGIPLRVAPTNLEELTSEIEGASEWSKAG
jgi:hypothetical protein